jgi:transposase
VAQVSDDLVPDDLWERVAPLLPPRPPRRRRYPGRLPVDDRAALRGIFHVLRTGVTWADVPTETIGRSGVTCRRRLRDWTEVGVWPRPQGILLAELRGAGQLDNDQ